MKVSRPKIAVIGGGLAGLTATYRLHQMGYEVELYEARNRLGGRVFTIKLGDNTAEMGGQSILDGGKSENILSLIQELGLEVESNKIRQHLSYFDGNSILDQNLLLKSYNFTPETLERRLNEIKENAENIKEVLEELFQEDKSLIKSFGALLSAYEGLPPEHLSLDALETLFHMILGGLSAAHQSDGLDESYITHLWVKGGNSRLIDKIAEKIPSGRIHLDSVLKSVTKNSLNSFVLTFKNGKEIQADILLLAIPCTVYADIEFEDGVIPSQTLSDISDIKYGTNSKILIPVSCEKSTKSTYQSDSFITFFPGEFHTAVMYYVGEHGIFDKDSIHNTYQHVCPLVKQAFTEQTNSPVVASDIAYSTYHGPVGYSWPNDPYAKGSYSCITAGQEQVFTSIQRWGSEKVKSLFVPIENKIFFAGEHTSILLEVDGTMEAAVESGERTARLIMTAMSNY